MVKIKRFKTLAETLHVLSGVSSEHRSFVDLIRPNYGIVLDNKIPLIPDTKQKVEEYKYNLFKYAYDTISPFTMLLTPRKVSLYFRDGDKGFFSEFFCSIEEGPLSENLGKWQLIVPATHLDGWELKP